MCCTMNAQATWPQDFQFNLLLQVEGLRALGAAQQSTLSLREYTEVLNNSRGL